MEIIIITQKDLLQFKEELVRDIKEMLNGKVELKQDKEWLKSADVRRILSVSPGTLQNLRISGTLPYKKIGGSLYYRIEDIRKMMEKNDHDKKQ